LYPSANFVPTTKEVTHPHNSRGLYTRPRIPGRTTGNDRE
jgi:hypothetical protein